MIPQYKTTPLTQCFKYTFMSYLATGGGALGAELHFGKYHQEKKSSCQRTIYCTEGLVSMNEKMLFKHRRISELFCIVGETFVPSSQLLETFSKQKNILERSINSNSILKEKSQFFLFDNLGLICIYNTRPRS